jgi:acetylornithine deacetylase/succinyl-diaminopimelate desuccinylase-like protein
MLDEQALRDYLTSNRERHISRIQEFIRQPTLPSEDKGVEDTAKLLASYYRELGCQEVEIIPTDGYPGVWAFYDAGAPFTIVNYCMFDTKPPDTAKWSVPPFEATRTTQDPHGEVILGCGARSRKGPYMTWLNALEGIIQTRGALPVNIMFLAEGEENQGSPHYAAMVQRYETRLRQAHACFSPGAAENNGIMGIRLGYKGLLFARLRATGAAWGRGPAGRNGHGMSQVLVDSPTWHLVHTLASLTEDEGRRVAVPGFYDQLEPPTFEEREEVRQLLAKNEGKRWQDVLGGVGGDVGASSAELSEEEAYLRYYYGPSFNINGLAAGYTGPGGPVFTLPGEAWALLDIRLPRGYRVEPVIEGIRRHLEATGRADVELEILSAHNPLVADPHTDLLAAVRQTCAEFGVEVDTQPYTAGGGGWSIFGNEFGIPVLFDVGIGHGGRAGAPDEYLVIDESRGHGLTHAEMWYAQFLNRYAQTRTSSRRD